MHTAGLSTVRRSSPPSRYLSPPGKISPSRTYNSESKRSHHSPEAYGSKSGQKHANFATSAASVAAISSQKEKYKEYVQELFSPLKAGESEETSPVVPSSGRNTMLATSLARTHRSNASLPSHHMVPAAPAARLFSPQPRSARQDPFESDITPYQPPRRRVGNSLPTGDISVHPNVLSSSLQPISAAVKRNRGDSARKREML